MKRSTLIRVFICLAFIIFIINVNCDKFGHGTKGQKVRLGIKNNATINLNTDHKRIYGIDVSHHQGKIEWSKVKKWKDKKLEFIYIKATEGATYLDRRYKTNLKQAKENDFLVGSYHYFRTTSSVMSQFQNFINHVDKNSQDLIPLIDVEEKLYWSSSEFHKNFQEFLDMVENHFGSKPMIYTVNSFYNKHLSGKYNSYHFLIGRYGKNNPNMRDNSIWTIWQFSEKGRVEGITKPVDIDVLNEKFSLNDLLLE